MSDQMTHPETAPHVSDGALISLIDGESAAISVDVQRHVEDCATCRERMSALQRRSVALSRALTLLDQPVPPARRPIDSEQRRLRTGAAPRHRRPWRPALRAAAGIVIVTGIAAAATVGGLGDRIREAVLKADPATVPAAAAPASPVPSAETGTAIAFDAGGERLVIEFATYQGVGSIEIATSSARQVRAQVVTDPGGEELVLMPGRLRVVNLPQSRATYRIVAPSSLRMMVLVGADTLYAGVPTQAQRLPLQR